ncbi:MAG: hypothetical protein JW806_01160 [Sedimentisphaerales bacterium]|nr:hypothetical protein [Sedimentisphaerales bacterium]
MAKDNNQANQQKPQSGQDKRSSVDKSVIKPSPAGDKGAKKGSSGDTTTTGSTGPRKKE